MNFKNPIYDDITYLKGVGPKRAEELKKYGINFIVDVLHHLPRKYLDRRNIKASLNIPPSKTINLYVRGPEKETNLIEKNITLLNRLANIDSIKAGPDIKKPNQSATAIMKNIELFIPLKGLIDLNQEIARLEKQIEDMNGRLNAINKKLDNQNFVDRAPKDVVAHEKNKKADYEQQLNKIQDNLQSLKD